MVYGLLAICLAVVVGFALAEVGTRALAPASGSAGTLDPGLFRYDARLGWRLSPNWSGRHVHEAYSAAYATNRHGFRGTFERARAPGTTRHAFLGDSFTFGFGVDDGHTFVDLLNAGGRGVSYLNFAVPGYSTDQQALLLADTVLDFAPESVHVVVYLGNDIFDNQRDIPIQGNARKPRFVNSPGGLALEGVPVPRGALPAADAAGGLRAIIFGEDASLGPLGSWFGWSALYRRAEPLLHRPSDLDAHFERNFAEALDLFAAITVQARDGAAAAGASFGLVLMPGPSFITRPRSVSARFQNYLRRTIVERSERLGIPVVDLAGLLRKRHERAPGVWFFPREGHLTVEGHCVVADELFRRMFGGGQGSDNAPGQTCTP